MANIDVELGKTVPLYQQLASTDTGLYPQVNILDQDSNVIDQVSLTHISSGLYRANWTPLVNTKATYFAQTIIYEDEEHTQESGIDRPGIDIIRIGPNAIGGAILGNSSSGGRSVGRFSLTDEELKKIARELFKLIEPKLEIKSEVTVDDASIKDIATQLSDNMAQSVGAIEDCIESGLVKIAKFSRETKDIVAKEVPEVSRCVKEIEGSVNAVAKTVDEAVDAIDELSVDIERYTDSTDSMSQSVAKSANRAISGLTEASNKVIARFNERIDVAVDTIPEKISKKLEDSDVIGPLSDQIAMAVKEVSGIKGIVDSMSESATSLAVDSAAQSGNITALVSALSRLSAPQRKAKVGKIKLKWPQVYQLLLNRL
jgi:methyl-accepting chemotaxis protein